MIGKKLGKTLLVWLCIITLLMPFGSEVLAAALTGNETSSVKLRSVRFREGGAEATGIDSEEYDTSKYTYKVGNQHVLKVSQANKDDLYVDTFYCINALLSLTVTQDFDYRKVADDFTNLSDSEVSAWAESVGISEENFNSLVYLLKNLYAKKIDPTYKDTFIANAFAEKIEADKNKEPATTVETIKETLTDDDIDVIQQWAIWYFSNGSTPENSYYRDTFTTLGNIKVQKRVGIDPETSEEILSEEMDIADLNPARATYATILYNYLIDTAKAHKTISNNENGNEEITYPSLDKTFAPTMVIDGEEYKAGPFKIKSGNVIPEDFVANITTEGGVLENGKFRITEDGTDITETFSNIQLDKEYYIYLPIEGNTITKISLDISYNKVTESERKITLWKGESDEFTLQPLVLITENPGDTEPVSENISVDIVNAPYDLALRKYIVSVNGVATTGRTPVPTDESLEKLADGSSKTAEYTHSKTPVEVKKGDKIVYEFRIYNEGTVNAKVKEIVDYLPEGLTVVDEADSTVNSSAKWKVNGNTITNVSLADKTISAFDKTSKTLSYQKVQVELEVTGDLVEGTVLTNIAEIVLDNGDDRDSNENSIKDNKEFKDNREEFLESYTGDKDNKNDLSDSNYYYKGLEDDDDFEKVKVVVEGKKQFDLSLQKFVSEVNGENQKREPQYDTTPLKEGQYDAKYTASKNPVTVETGDIVTFTLRVYNEGEIDGYAEEITDYIPEGLAFLPFYNVNQDNCWSIPKDLQITTKKLSEIKNGTKNLKLTDFSDVETAEKLEDVEVVLGRNKIKSTALASSSTSTSNLLKAFDGSDKLDYKDVKVSFIVVTEDELVLKNIAAITKESDKDRNDIETDRVPEKDSSPKDDIDVDKYTTGNEDDDDYDVIKTDKKDFDLALQKFITGLNDEEVKDREPVVSSVDGKIKYTHPDTEPLEVGNGDLITYTLRVYNEGQIDGYAAEVQDDIPVGLVFVPDNEINKEYKWKMYDKSGKETSDPKLAVSVKTTYLSKESSENNLIKAYDGKTLDSKDLKVVFKIDETAIEQTVTTDKRIVINTAEISKNEDKDGKDIQDIDSTPGNNKLDEDDIDQEKVYIKYFDLALEKEVKKAIVTTNNETREVVGDNIKIEIHKKNINNTTIQFVYTIKVTNEGEIEGYATEITDYIPEGLSFNKASNPDWTQVSEREIKTDALAKTLLQPKESAEVQVVLDWVKSSENIGRFVNLAEISEDWNPNGSHDIDSTPGNKKLGEDDIDEAPVWVGIVTGLGDRPFIILPTVVLVILATGVILIKKYVL